MRGLSISAAWEETRDILARDGRLLTTVALALIALPTTVNTLINPGGVNAASTPLWMDCVALVVYLIALAGQLSLIRLALGPSITVGGAIVHGTKRLPVYIAAVFLVVILLLIVLVVISLVLGALGVRVDRQMTAQMSPAALVAVLLFLAIFIFLFVRMVLSAPVASAEHVGPIAILQRSWRLTEGHWWQLFGFLLIFFAGAALVVLAIGSAAGVVIGLLFGKIQPMSGPALALALIDAFVSAAITTLFAVMLARLYLQLARGSGVQASVPSSGI
ncbi:hypothetical protein [Sphingomonas agri]|uniref:hypothetical protein n=1 Tax=Sphingomonas agri TaxID=1813878 RepID=UPI00311FD0C5